MTLATPTRAGYTFDGWYTNDQLTGDKVTGFVAGTYTGDQTFYAKWTAAEFTVAYDLDGGALPEGESNPGTYTVETATIKLVAPSKDNYTFDGWYTDADVKVTEIGGGMTGNLELTARWTPESYEITYELNGGVNAVSNPDHYSFGDVVVLENPTRDGYHFEGWFLDAEFDGKPVAGIAASSAGDAKFYAKWSAEEYTATYDLAGGSMEGDNSFTFTIESEDITLATPSMDGYTFDGWLDSKTGNVITILSQGSFGARTLTAQWTLTPALITVAAVTQEFEYDGNAHSTTCEVTSENPWGFTITASSTESVENVAEGSVEATCGDVVIMDGENDVTASFDGFIETVPGTISVKAKETSYGAVTISTDENGASAIIDGTSEETVSITDKDNVVVKAITFNRTFPVNAEGENKMSTLVLPFSIAKNKVEGAEFYELNDVVGTKVRIWKSLDVLEANTPYIIRTTADHLTFNLEEDEKISFNTEKMNDSKSSDGLWTIHGVYSYKKWEEGDPELGRAYGYTAKATNNLTVGKFARNGPGAYIKPLRAYLLKTSEEKSSKARRMLAKSYSSIVGESTPDEMDVEIVDRETGETTVIGKLNPATGEIRMINEWFDMKGRKLNSKPTTKGIYYFNGKQVIVR